ENCSSTVKNLIFFQRQKHGILSNENQRWKGLFFWGYGSVDYGYKCQITLFLRVIWHAQHLVFSSSFD
ncbi:hypothetical protein ABEV13_11595, partial [Geobacillus stearothermophilus]